MSGASLVCLARTHIVKITLSSIGGGNCCTYAWALPQAPSRPAKLQAREGVLKMMGYQASSDYVAWASSSSPAFDRNSDKEKSAVALAALRDNFAGTQPSWESGRIWRTADRRDVIRSCALHTWAAACS